MNAKSSASAESVLLFDYYGLEVFLLSTDRLPVHIYARSGDCMAVADIRFANGIFSGLDMVAVPDAEMIDQRDQKNFEAILEEYLSEIVRAWIDYFVFNRTISSEKILQKIGV